MWCLFFESSNIVGESIRFLYGIFREPPIGNQKQLPKFLGQAVKTVGADVNGVG